MEAWEDGHVGGEGCWAGPGAQAGPRGGEASKAPKGAKCQEMSILGAPESGPPPTLRFCILGTSLAPVESWLQPLVSVLPHPTDLCDWETAAPTWLTLQPSALELLGPGSHP